MTLFNTPSVEDPFFLEQLTNERSLKSRILLAEDDREMRCLLAAGLKQDGHEIVEAENGLELLQHLEPAFLHGLQNGPWHAFDVVVSDLRLPCFSAFAVLGAFRKHDPLTPVILITAFGDDLTHGEARSIGITTVMDKPFEIDDLRAAVRRAIPKRRAIRPPLAG